MVDHLDTKNFVPFSKRRNGFQLPGARKSPDEEMLEQVDPNLRPEDEGVIRRYLHYADTLLCGPDESRPALLPGSVPGKELAGQPEPRLESHFEGFKPDLLDRVKAERKRRTEDAVQEADTEAPVDEELAREQDHDKAA